MVEKLTIEEIVTMLSTAQTITDEKRLELLKRLAEETKDSKNGTVFSTDLMDQLIHLFESELLHIERDVVPDEWYLFDDVEDEYARELADAQPNLDILIHQYDADLDDFELAYTKEYHALDKELDLVAQFHSKKNEEEEIASIKKKLKKS